MENKEIKAMKSIGIMLMKASGMDIVPPAELQDQAIRALDLEKDAKFDEIEFCIRKMKDKEKRLQYIRALILTQLTPSQMMSLHEDIRIGIEAISDYVEDHPECKEQSSPEEIMDALSRC